MSETVEDTVKKYARNSLRAYFEGSKSLGWVVGTVRSSSVRGQALAEIFASLKGEYGETERYKEVYSACKEQGWLD